MKMLRFALVAVTLMLPNAVAPVCALQQAGETQIVPVPMGTVSVVAHDESGKLLANLKVQITLLGPTDPVVEGRTDRAGKFMQTLPAGRYRMTISDGEALVRKDFALAQGELKAFRIEMPSLADDERDGG